MKYGNIISGLEVLSLQLQYYLGEVNINVSNIELLTVLLAGDVICSTDESAHTASLNGSYLFVLAIATHPQQLLFGGGKLLPDNNVLLQQTEHYGVIGLITILIVLQQCIPTATYLQYPHGLIINTLNQDY